MKKMRYIAVILAVMAYGSIRAVNYADILLQIDNNNVELKAMGARNSADMDELRAGNSLGGPEVDFSYLFGDPSVGDKWEIGASQSFEWLGVYHARSKVISSRSESLDYQYEATRRDIHTQVLAQCCEMVWVNKQLALYNEIVADVDSLMAAYNKAFQHGEVSILDINKLKLETVAARRMVKNLESRRAELQVSLAELNGGVALTGIVFDEYPLLQMPASIDAYVAVATEKDPMALYFKKRNAADEYDVSVAKRSLLPSFSVGYRHVNELGDRFNGVTAGVSLPLYSGKKSIKAARARKEANRYEAELWEKSVTEELTKEYTLAQSLADEHNMYDVVLPKDNIELLHKALNAGQISLVEYLLEKRFFTEALIEQLEVEYLYMQSLNSINRYNY
ncbi:MAG: TolC family protein [Muribaculaceae bacterium]|nr:TolC family protein [Muribaculaceae bacterium]